MNTLHLSLSLPLSPEAADAVRTLMVQGAVAAPSTSPAASAAPVITGTAPAATPAASEKAPRRSRQKADGASEDTPAPSAPPTPAASNPAPAATPQPAATVAAGVTHEDLVAAVKDLTGRLGMGAVRELLKKFKAGKLSDIEPNRRAEFLAEVASAGAVTS